MSHNQMRWGMICLALTFSVMSQVREAQAQAPPQPPTTPPKLEVTKPANLEVKVGWFIGDPNKADPSVPPSVDPIADATVVLMSDNRMVIGVKKTNSEGLISWPRQRSNFELAVLVVGYPATTWKIASEEVDASLIVIALIRQNADTAKRNAGEK